MKTTKGGKVMNPTDAFRKEQRKRELKRNKKERKKVREVGILKKDPEQLKDQIQKLEVMKAEGALDKARKHKKRQLEDTLNLVIKKKKEYEEKMKEKGEPPVMFSHLGPPKRLSTAEEEERLKHPKPEDSVYFHPTLNPTGAPPPGKPPMFKSSIGPRVPMGEASSSGTATSESELEDATMAMPPLPPPPPLPHSGDAESAEDSILRESLPLPPPPPIPSKPAVTNLGSTSLPPLPPPPPPPGPPPKEQNASHSLLPPPPPLRVSAQPPPPGTAGSEIKKGLSAKMTDAGIRSSVQTPTGLPPPPPPPGLPLKPAAVSSDSDTKGSTEAIDHAKMMPPPPPPPIRPPMAGPAMVQVQPDMLRPGISHFPPPPPDMRPPGIAGHPVPPGMMAPLIQGSLFGSLPGPPPMMRPPLPPGPPPMMLSHNNMAPPFAPQKPSYVKSAASTVVKRPLAQHTPELTAMVPASVRVRRESALPKPKPKPSTASATSRPVTAPIVMKQESTSTPSAPKPPSIDDSYMAFLEDMKALGALES
ncbi:hypothetical protein Leryth_017654 [Lithospermum erythrorhizon]|nr:hypothetical protein Leryth_017654 [Lithospermum erythrorhizon]